MWGRIGRTLRTFGTGLAKPAVVGAALCGGSWAQAEEQQFDVRVVAPRFAGYVVDLDVGGISVEDAEEAARSEYWIGVQLGEVPEIAKSQLRLEYGLATIAVMEDSPALKAGVQAHDILLKVDDKPLREPIELVRAVNDAKDRAFKLTLLRGGKEQTVELTPAKRPQPEGDVARVLTVTEGEKNPELAAVERALRAWQERAGVEKGQDPQGLGLWFVRPPVWATPQMTQALSVAELPKDVHVTIEKQGAETAKVTVRRGDKKWETTADKLDVLPEDVRDPVARMTGKCQITVAAKVLTHPDLPGIYGGGGGGAIPGAQGVPGVPGIQVVPPGVPVVPAVPAPPPPRTLPPLPGGQGGVQVERRAVVVAPQGGDGSLLLKLDKILERIDRLEKSAGSKSSANDAKADPSEAIRAKEALDDLRRENEKLRKELEELSKAKKS